ncbi:Ctr copper transporter family-domain-containing protein [Zychaea mexicana]|uniref:Ctr copper transporter family-domain-containing protein n=1 Tax=Zychaea mexicana TaxID=64656 RepID=UPI0022FE8527|nr:Ctr copper transporter family-domain-containing protein [Zychaea mexicana]KAI9488540.1 Ctr copper transporter family-domain-containing protein [Zychaea mexicana]
MEQEEQTPRRHRRPLSLSNPENEVRSVGTFHWTSDAANTLWLTGWIPKNENEYLSACLGLFLMAVLARGLAGIKVSLAAWLNAQEYHRQLLPLASRSNNNHICNGKRPRSGAPTTIMPWVPPFAWKPDILRSICATLEHFLMFLLIMVVMTGNVQYFVSILAGILVGEMMFGRLHDAIPRLPVYKYY